MRGRSAPNARGGGVREQRSTPDEGGKRGATHVQPTSGGSPNAWRERAKCTARRERTDRAAGAHQTHKGSAPTERRRLTKRVAGACQTQVGSAPDAPWKRLSEASAGGAPARVGARRLGFLHLLHLAEPVPDEPPPLRDILPPLKDLVEGNLRTILHMPHVTEELVRPPVEVPEVREEVVVSTVEPLFDHIEMNPQVVYAGLRPGLGNLRQNFVYLRLDCTPFVETAVHRGFRRFARLPDDRRVDGRFRVGIFMDALA
ncbi:hypothetical protein FB451DRAFT_1385219 [Mycena latifolia]|nr:hypothetical protein FB451DRAFT_1385219 [Mycena latifolia]